METVELKNPFKTVARWMAEVNHQLATGPNGMPSATRQRLDGYVRELQGIDAKFEAAIATYAMGVSDEIGDDDVGEPRASVEGAPEDPAPVDVAAETTQAPAAKAAKSEAKA